MIIIRTSSGSHLINEEAVIMVENCQSRKEVRITASSENGKHTQYTITSVESVKYFSKGQLASWEELGSEVEFYKARAKEASDRWYKAKKELNEYLCAIDNKIYDIFRVGRSTDDPLTKREEGMIQAAKNAKGVLGDKEKFPILNHL